MIPGRTDANAAGRRLRLLMLWTAPPPARERHGNGAVEAPTIQRSQACRRLRRSVSISRSRFFRFAALMRLGKWWITRWEHEHLLEAVQERLDANPHAMRQR